MKKLAIFVAAFVLTFGLAQCKKEQPTAQTTEGETVHITVKVGNGSRADIDDPSNSGHYTFNEGDILYVGYNGAKVDGELTYSTSTSSFSGELTIAQAGNDKPLYFYYMGGTAATMVDATHYTVDISNQTSNYPVISCGTSSDPYTGPGRYTTTLENQCALVKFTTNEIPTTTDIIVSGLNNTVEVNFNGNTLSYSQTPDAAITLHPESTTSRWAILLPQTNITNVKANAEGYNEASVNFTVTGISENDYLTNGATMTLTEQATPPQYYDKLTRLDGDQYIQNTVLQYMGEGRVPYNSSLTTTEAYALATYQAAHDDNDQPVYVVMSVVMDDDWNYYVHYACSTDAAAEEHTTDPMGFTYLAGQNMYYVAP